MLVDQTRRLYESSRNLREAPLIGYGFAVAASAFGLGIRFALGDALEGFPFVTFFPMIVLTAFVFGWRAGLVASVAGGAFSAYFLLPAQWSLDSAGPSNWIGFGLYCFTSVVILFLTAAMHRGFLYYEISDRERRLMNEQLEVRVRERTETLEAVNEQLRNEAQSRIAAEALIRQMQKMEAIGQLTGGIAHDFNNTLAIVIGSLDMAKRHFDRDRVKVIQSLDNAMEGARRAAQLTARLLAFSRQQPLNPCSVDVNKLVSGMSEMLERTLGGVVQLETVLAGGLWKMFADSHQLESAIINLCVNSRDAMPDGGRITLETMNAHLDETYAAAHSEVQAGQYVAIAVTDTGIGMTAEVLARAFDPFFTTKQTGQGTGLGLSQVYGFAKQSGGHVKIYSELAQGTTVRLYLPRYVGPEMPALPANNAETPVTYGTPAEVVLVVEDDERVRHVSVEALRDLNYTVVQASGAKQALELIETRPDISLLFTDVVMPEMNGRLLADRVKERRPDIKVLYTTGYTRNAVIHNGTLDRDVYFLPKPFTIEQLAAKIRQVMEQRGS